MAAPSQSLPLLQAKLPGASPRPSLETDVLHSPSAGWAQGTNEGESQTLFSSQGLGQEHRLQGKGCTEILCRYTYSSQTTARMQRAAAKRSAPELLYSKPAAGMSLSCYKCPARQRANGGVHTSSVGSRIPVGTKRPHAHPGTTVSRAVLLY